MKHILVRYGYTVTAVCLTGAQVILAAADLEEGLILSGVRYVDMVYHELRKDLPESFEMVVVANHTEWEEYGGDDVIWLPLPMKVYDLVTTVEDVISTISRRRKRQALRRRRSPEEEGLIASAKKLLMAHKGFSEEEAHHYLQKISMDSGSNLVDTAYMVRRLLAEKNES